LNKVNSYGINLQSKCGFLSKTKELSEYHAASIKTPKKLHKQSLYSNINIYMGEIKEIIEAMGEVLVTALGY
jgi:hypothetical protein